MNAPSLPRRRKVPEISQRKVSFPSRTGSPLRYLCSFAALRRILKSNAIALLILGIAATTTDAVAAEPLTPLNLALLWKPQSQFAGFYLARDKGFYRDAGLDVTLLHGSYKQSSLKMLANGQADLATAFLVEALVKAPDSSLIVQLIRRSNLMLIGWKEKGVNDVSSLDQQRVSHWEDASSLTFSLFFAKNGVHPQIIPQYYSINLFLHRGVVACSAMEYNEYHLLAQAGVDPDQITTFMMRDYGLDFPEDGLYARSDWIDRHPETALAVRRATLAGWEYARAHPEEALDIVIAEAHRAKLPVNRPHERWMLRHILNSIFVPGSRPEEVGTLSPSAFKASTQALIGAGLLKKAPDYSRFAPFDQVGSQ